MIIKQKELSYYSILPTATVSLEMHFLWFIAGRNGKTVSAILEKRSMRAVKLI
jgi:hypothetical protein